MGLTDLIARQQRGIAAHRRISLFQKRQRRGYRGIISRDTPVESVMQLHNVLQTAEGPLRNDATELGQPTERYRGRCNAL